MQNSNFEKIYQKIHDTMINAYSLFVINGIGEILAALLFMYDPSILGFSQALDDNSRFLFTCWAFSLVGFGVTTLSAASDAAKFPERTRSITTGAICYHTGVATCYLYHVHLQVILSDWYIGALLHVLGAILFSRHLLYKVNGVKSR